MKTHYKYNRNDTSWKITLHFHRVRTQTVYVLWSSGLTYNSLWPMKVQGYLTTVCYQWKFKLI